MTAESQRHDFVVEDEKNIYNLGERCRICGMTDPVGNHYK